MSYFFISRCLWLIRRQQHRTTAGEISVRPGGILQDAVPQSADQVRQAPPQAPFLTDCVLPSHRATVFCKTGGQDAHRDSYQGHASQWQLFQLAVYAAAVTLSTGAHGHCGGPRPETAVVHGGTRAPECAQEIAVASWFLMVICASKCQQMDKMVLM